MKDNELSDDLFDMQAKDQYKQIKAPSQLKERILTAEVKPQKKKNHMKQFTVVAAACLVIIAGIAGMTNHGATEIYAMDALLVNSVTIQTPAANLEFGRSMDVPGEEESPAVSVKLRLTRTAIVTAECGQIEDAEGTVLAEENQSIAVNKEEDFFWSVPENHENEKLLNIKTNKTETVLSLSEDEAGAWELTREEIKK